MSVKFSGNYMEQTKVMYPHNSVINIYIVYELKRTVNTPDFAAQSCLLGAVQITKDVNTSHYKYSGYGICFDAKGSFTSGSRNDATNVIILDCDMTSFGNDYTGRTDIHVLGKTLFKE